MKDNVLIVAHRGASSLAPENTMIAFEKAVELKCKAMECDVQYTKDKKIIVFHDEFIKTNYEGRVAVRNTNYEDIKKLHEGANIPLFDELLKFSMDKEIILVIDIKSNNITIVDDLINKVINKKYEDGVILGSFNEKFLERSKGICSKIKTEIYFYWLHEKPQEIIKRTKVDYLCPEKNFVLTKSKEFFKDIISNGNNIHTFTVDSKLIGNLVVAKGVSSIITNYPQKFI